MSTIDRHQLHFGPYETPEFRYGAAVECRLFGEVTVTGLSDAPIPWPLTTRQGGSSLVLFGDLARAVECEAACAVAHWFGVSTWMVRKWRRSLGVPARNNGDRLLKQVYARGKPGQMARSAALATATDPARRAKISAALRGKARPAHVVAAIRQSMTGRKLTEEHRAKVIPFLSRRHRLAEAARGSANRTLAKSG